MTALGIINGCFLHTPTLTHLPKLTSNKYAYEKEDLTTKGVPSTQPPLTNCSICNHKTLIKSRTSGVFFLQCYDVLCPQCLFSDTLARWPLEIKEEPTKCVNCTFKVLLLLLLFTFSAKRHSFVYPEPSSQRATGHMDLNSLRLNKM